MKRPLTGPRELTQGPEQVYHVGAGVSETQLLPAARVASVSSSVVEE